MRFPVIIAVLFYGDYPHLCRRFLQMLYRHTALERFALRVGLNAACAETADLVASYSSRYGNIWVHAEAQNRFKSPMMRQLLLTQELDSEWLIWFDDDSFPYRGDWLQTLAVQTEIEPEVAVWGNLFFTEADPALVRFIRSASWYRHVPFNHWKRNGERSDNPVITFAEGGFWAVRTQVLRKLDWPDPRLIQTEDDYVFGEALRQNGFKLGKFRSGIRINQEPRRCPEDTPRTYG